MKKRDYEKAKSSESFIAEIDSILTDIKNNQHLIMFTH